MGWHRAAEPRSHPRAELFSGLALARSRDQLTEVREEVYGRDDVLQEPDVTGISVRRAGRGYSAVRGPSVEDDLQHEWDAFVTQAYGR
jgi:DNA-binding IclR family transcriptional regulator